MQPYRIAVTGLSSTNGAPMLVPDLSVSPFNISIATVASTGQTYSVQHTYDYTGSSTFISSNATWFTLAAHSSIAGANAEGFYLYPTTAIRLNVTAGSSTGTVRMIAVQAG